MLFTTQLGVLVVVNLLGAAFLGWANGDRRFSSDNSGAFWKVGFSGGFTTMSGVALYLANIQTGIGQLLIVIAMMLIGVLTYRLAKLVAVRWTH
jgi:fluoride ion exporter CrcB/FEX